MGDHKFKIGDWVEITNLEDHDTLHIFHGKRGVVKGFPNQGLTNQGLIKVYIPNIEETTAFYDDELFPIKRKKAMVYKRMEL